MKIARTLTLAATLTASPALPLTCAIVALPTLGASAQQLKSIDPTWAVIEKPAVVHCGDSQRYYRVAELQPGTMVRVDGESADWARISYTAGLGAFVRAESVKQGEAADSLALTAPSRLYAANAIAGFDGSWKALLSEAQTLPAGTTLKALETVRSAGGAVVGYKVVAPESARGYVLRTSLRSPTPEELASAGAAPAPAAPTPSDSQPATTPATADNTQPATAPGTDTSTPPATGTSPTIDTSGEGPVVIEQKPVVPSQPPPPAPGSLQALDESFRKVQAQTDADAEIDALKAELQAALDRVGDTPQNRITRAGLQQRIDILTLRADWRDRLRAMEERRLAATAATGVTEKTITDLQQNRVYTITGKLMTSELYDGTRLPRMLRVQSVGGATTRTIGYIKPDPSLALDGKIGQTVGVVGNIILDPRTGLRTIEATKVEVLTNVPTDARVPGAE